MRTAVVTLVLACLTLPACHSLDRLWRNSPLAGDPDPDRVNLWPVYYQSGEGTAILWPIFDVDADGFALRPIVTKDGNNWEFLPPIAWWETDSGEWMFLPAYSFEDNYGVFPLFGVGDANYVGPAWWSRPHEDGGRNVGLLPLATFTDGFNHAGPVWWNYDENGEVSSYGLFPLVDIGHGFNNFGPVFWGYDDKGEMDYLIGFPLFGWGESEDGAGMLVTLLGGKGWDEEGQTDFINVLGPVYHYNRSDRGESTSVLWPIWHQFDGPARKSWSLFPLLGREHSYNEEGDIVRTETSALAGVIKTEHDEELQALRVLGLASYRSENAGIDDLADYLTLFGYRGRADGYSWHFGTPLVFDYDSRKDRLEWSALLRAFHYESRPDESEFQFLWYLYRQKTKGTETQRDFFPFVSWDTGEERSRFSLLWRLFNWERNGDKTGGHFLFIPWGDV